MTQIKDLQNELQSAKVSACCSIIGTCYCWLITGPVSETGQCTYNTWKVHFRAVLIKNNLNACSLHA